MSLGSSIITGLARLLGISLVELVKERDDVVLEIDPTPQELTELAAERTDTDRDTQDAILETLCEQLDRDPDDVFWKPLETIEEIPDRPTDTYIWILKDGVDPAGFADQIDNMYRQHFNRPPRGMHIPVNDLEELRLADPGEIRTYVAPHLKRAEEAEAAKAGNN